MKKIDVAVQSFNKPESLIYSLLTLHKYCKDDIDTVWINDDKSKIGTIEKYIRLSDSNILDPWKVKIRQNERRMGWWVSFCRGKIPDYASFSFVFKRMIWNAYNTKSIFVDENDFRYQWAINNTDKDRLLIIHDDVQFTGRVTDLLSRSIAQQDKPGITGDLGQCWRCIYQTRGCTPKKIIDGVIPSPQWPLTREKEGDHKWACRVNEWLALLDVEAARYIAKSENIFFGNYDDDGDIGAYWFSRLNHYGYKFGDPFADGKIKSDYFIHWDGGITGHSAWVNQGDGKNEYKPQDTASKILREFEYEV
ncbi:hypothetical protein [Vibrio tasmaniensis]|uniref:hypothetical protein n=1 Tax=Vibrio tasmaniensis TaxID=212663 RepID=UPI001080967E|nr:hypothetical protein [Vibrio tasmaniensis]